MVGTELISQHGIIKIEHAAQLNCKLEVNTGKDKTAEMISARTVWKLHQNGIEIRQRFAQ